MIIVTGSGGPLGSAVKKFLGDSGAYPRSYECDFTNLDQMQVWFEDYFKGKKVDGIIHLAAKSGGAHLSETEPAEIFRINMLMAINILELATILKIPRVILTLSTSCYSEILQSPSEDKLHFGAVLGKDYAYAYAKRMMEPLMRAYNKQYGLNVSCVLVNGIIGPDMNFRENESILPAALIKRFFESKLKGSQEFTVWGDGTPVREYSDSADLARAVLWCYQHQEADTLLNIGSTEKTSVRKCAELIAKSLKIDPTKIHFDLTKTGGRVLQSTDNSKFVKMSNFIYTPFEQSIGKTVEWYVAQKKGGFKIKI